MRETAVRTEGAFQCERCEDKGVYEMGVWNRSLQIEQTRYNACYCKEGERWQAILPANRPF